MPEDFANRIGFREEPGTVFRPEHHTKPNPWEVMQLAVFSASVAAVGMFIILLAPKDSR